MVRMTSRVGVGVRERLIGALDALCEMTQVSIITTLFCLVAFHFSYRDAMYNIPRYP